MATESKLRGYPVAVGDKVIVRGVNIRKGAPLIEYVVTKIGPKRLAWESGHRTRYASLEHGTVDDWEYVVTVAEFEEMETRADLTTRIRMCGLTATVSWRYISTDKLIRILAVLEEDDGTS